MNETRTGVGHPRPGLSMVSQLSTRPNALSNVMGGGWYCPFYYSFWRRADEKEEDLHSMGTERIA
jgi:hypothetical protein